MQASVSFATLSQILNQLSFKQRLYQAYDRGSVQRDIVGKIGCAGLADLSETGEQRVLPHRESEGFKIRIINV
jgi:hypothetical protein